MNKIDISSLTRRHWSSIMARDDNQYPISEVIVFLLLPIFVGYIFAKDVALLSDDFFAAVISCYSIFAALLLSVQMALFGIFQRQSIEKTAKNKSDEQDRILLRLKLIKELNTNVSFLIVLSIASAIISIVFLVLNIAVYIEVFICFMLLTQFLFNTLLVIRRTYLLFDIEYSN